MSWYFMVIVVGSAAAASCVWWPHRVGDSQTKDSPDHLNRVKNDIHVEDVETVLAKIIVLGAQEGKTKDQSLRMDSSSIEMALLSLSLLF